MTARVYVGWDSRQEAAYEVCKHSILRKASIPVEVIPLKHRKLRKDGFFRRPWRIDSESGLLYDTVDNRPMSTEFAFTRFLVPALQNFQGWALFCDCDMLFQEDIKEIFAKTDDRCAAMVVKHRHVIREGEKMDEQLQLNYHRKNWSSFVLWNCAHPANKILTPELIGMKPGYWLHALEWLREDQIEHLGWEYNWIDGFSPHVHYPRVIHYTEGGPWLETHRDVKFADNWMEEYERWQADGGGYCAIPSIKRGG